MMKYDKKKQTIHCISAAASTWQTTSAAAVCPWTRTKQKQRMRYLQIKKSRIPWSLAGQVRYKTERQSRRLVLAKHFAHFCLTGGMQIIDANYLYVMALLYEACIRVTRNLNDQNISK